MIIENELTIYTDGSSKEKPRRGGIGIRFIFPDYKKETEEYDDYSMGSYVGATNQQMELFACIIALVKCLEFNELNKLKRIIIRTDSNYVINNINNAKYFWPKNNWLAIDCETPIENVKYWKQFTKVMNKFKLKIAFEKVKAHTKKEFRDKHNDIVDDLAKNGADSTIKIPFELENARKKYSPYQAKKGSVRITNEPLEIRVVDCKDYVEHPNLFKIKYVVVSKKNPDYQCLDWVFHNKRLPEGRTLIVIIKKKNKITIIDKILDDKTKKSRFKLVQYKS